MRTDDLISALAADLEHKPAPVGRSLLVAMVVSLPLALGVLLLMLHPRPDLLASLGTPRIWFKFVLTLTAFAAAAWLALRLSRPGKGVGLAGCGLCAVAAVLAAGVGLELAALPAGSWVGALVGEQPLACVVLIPLLGALPFAAIMTAMRAGAPDSPAKAGASAGFLAGAIGATLYATHCTNDSPLFVATWYLIGISATTVLGAVVGQRALRW